MDREEAINDLNVIKAFFEEESNAYPISLDYAIKVLENHVDIVLCKECKWYRGDYCSRGIHLFESVGWIRRNADDFCSYGERRE